MLIPRGAWGGQWSHRDHYPGGTFPSVFGDQGRIQQCAKASTAVEKCQGGVACREGEQALCEAMECAGCCVL